jgi:ubiquinone/menaquinone biosynthesis C-methylase UbiE
MDCGTGAVIRDVARRTAGANRLIGVDVSPYMLRAAQQLARRDGFGIEFRDGQAEALPSRAIKPDFQHGPLRGVTANTPF